MSQKAIFTTSNYCGNREETKSYNLPFVTLLKIALKVLTMQQCKFVRKFKYSEIFVETWRKKRLQKL